MDQPEGIQREQQGRSQVIFFKVQEEEMHLWGLWWNEMAFGDRDKTEESSDLFSFPVLGTWSSPPALQGRVRPSNSMAVGCPWCLWHLQQCRDFTKMLNIHFPVIVTAEFFLWAKSRLETCCPAHLFVLRFPLAAGKTCKITFESFQCQQSLHPVDFLTCLLGIDLLKEVPFLLFNSLKEQWHTWGWASVGSDEWLELTNCAPLKCER